MAKVPEQKRQSIVFALTDHDLGNEGLVEIDVNDSSEELTTDVDYSLYQNQVDLTTHGSQHGTKDNEPSVETVVQVPNEQRVSISKRLRRQKNAVKSIEDRFKKTMQDRQMLIDSIFVDEHKDLHGNLHNLEIVASDKEICHQPRHKTNSVDHDQNLEEGRTERDIIEKQRDACSNACFKKHGRHHADLKDARGLKPTMKRILPMTIMRLL